MMNALKMLVFVVLLSSLGLSTWFNSSYDCKREIDITNPSNNISTMAISLTNSANFTYGQVVNSGETAYLPFYREYSDNYNITRFMNPASNSKVFLYGCNNTAIGDNSNPNFEVQNDSYIKYLYYGNTLEDYAKNEGLVSNGLTYADGKIGSAFYVPTDYSGISNYNNSAISANMKVFNFWWKPNETVDSTNSAADIKTLISIGARGDPRFGIYIYLGTMYGRNVAGGLLCDPTTATTSWTANTWYNIAWVQDGSTCYFLINGAEDGAGSSSGTGISAGVIGIGSFADGSNHNSVMGTIDEIYISSAWEHHLYNYNQATYSIGASTANIGPPDNFTIVNQIYPVNGTTNTTNDIWFGFNVSASTTSIGCSLWIDGMVNQTNASVTNDTLTKFYVTGFENDTYLWSVNCTIAGLGNWTGNNSLEIAKAYPVAPPSNTTINGSVSITIIDPLYTHQYCIDNVTLEVNATETITIGGIETNVSRISRVACQYGCDLKNNACNPTAFNKWLNYGYLFIGVIIALILIMYAGRKAKGIRF